jgi:hypothetical protein
LKVFYALRPRRCWLRLDPSRDRRCISDADGTIRAPQFIDIVDGLLARKAATRELGTSALPTPIGRFIDEEFSAAGSAFDAAPIPPTIQAREAATALFRTWANFRSSEN